MADQTRQLVLDLPVATRFGAEDFLVSPSNEEAFRFVGAWPTWPAPVALLLGPPGSGKTHLASIWSERSGARILAARDVTAEAGPADLSGGALVVEDLQAGPLDEGALFHLLNAARAAGAFLLLTSTAPADRLGLATPDLVSRLRLAPTLGLGPPDDATLKAVLVKLFADRQIAVDASTVDYLATRIERSLRAASEAVAALDLEALSRGRRVTRPMAVEWIAAHPPPDGGEDEDRHCAVTR